MQIILGAFLGVIAAPLLFFAAALLFREEKQLDEHGNWS